MRKQYFYVLVLAAVLICGAILVAPAHASENRQLAPFDSLNDIFGLEKTLPTVFSKAINPQSTGVQISLPNVVATPGVVVISITTGNVTGLEAIAYQLQVTFNPSVIEPASPPFERAGTISSGMAITPNPNFPGHLIIAAYQSANLTGAGTLLYLRFNVIGAPGQSTALTLENYVDPNSLTHPGFRFNEGSPAAKTTSGSLTIPAATPTFTPTPTATSTFTPTATSTSTFTPTATETFTPTPTATETFTPTATATETFTPTATATETFTPTSTATDTPTNTPTVVPTPSLGTYPSASIALSTNTTVTPDVAPLNATSMDVSASTNFKGKLEADPTTGIVRVTNAHPAGTHLVTVAAFSPTGLTNTRAFTVTVTTPAVCNPVSFAPAGGAFGGDIAVLGDFNGDGNQDLATAVFSNFSTQVAVRFGDGTGSLNGSTSVPVGSNPRSLAVGDFNGDGAQDLVVGSTNTNSLTIAYGTGSGTFSSGSIDAGAIEAVAVSDFNGDQRQDIVTLNAFGAGIIWFGNGMGGFPQTIGFTAGSGSNAVIVGDFNADGKQDLAVSNQGSNNISVLLNTGSGTFFPAVNYGANSPTSIALGDFNGDGKQDFAFGSGGVYKVGVYLGNSDGTFYFFGGFDTVSYPGALAVGDFNGDSNQDIVALSNYPTLDVSILLGDGLGSFSLASSFAAANVSSSAIVGDFNNDGKQDILAASIFLRNCEIRGAVTYGNAVGAPSPRFVSNVQMNAAGMPAASTTTGAAGQYSLNLFGSGPYTITPAKTGGANGINSFDASRVAAHAAGVSLLTGNQLLAADVSNNGSVQSLDASMIARFVTGLASSGIAGTWKFLPASRTYSTLTSNLTGEDYSAILMGEVTGNWQNTSGQRSAVGGQSVLSPHNGASSGVSSPHVSKGSTLSNDPVTDMQTPNALGPIRGIEVSLPKAAMFEVDELVVPVTVDHVANKGITAYEFNLRYDPSVIQPLPDPIDQKNTVSRGLSFVANAAEPGLLRVAVYGPTSISENGVLLNLRFKTVGAVGSASPLTWEKIIFNDGSHRPIFANGRIEISATGANWSNLR